MDKKPLKPTSKPAAKEAEKANDAGLKMNRRIFLGTVSAIGGSMLLGRLMGSRSRK